MRHLLWVTFALALTGCGSLQPPGTVPAHLSCKGKGTLVGTASGFSGVNMAIDCGDGLIFDSGPDPLPAPVLPQKP